MTPYEIALLDNEKKAHLFFLTGFIKCWDNCAESVGITEVLSTVLTEFSEENNFPFMSADELISFIVNSD